MSELETKARWSCPADLSKRGLGPLSLWPAKDNNTAEYEEVAGLKGIDSHWLSSPRTVYSPPPHLSLSPSSSLPPTPRLKPTVISRVPSPLFLYPVPAPFFGLSSAPQTHPFIVSSPVVDRMEPVANSNAMAPPSEPRPSGAANPPATMATKTQIVNADASRLIGGHPHSIDPANANAPRQGTAPPTGPGNHRPNLNPQAPVYAAFGSSASGSGQYHQGAGQILPRSGQFGGNTNAQTALPFRGNLPPYTGPGYAVPYNSGGDSRPNHGRPFVPLQAPALNQDRNSLQSNLALIGPNNFMAANSNFGRPGPPTFPQPTGRHHLSTNPQMFSVAPGPVANQPAFFYQPGLPGPGHANSNTAIVKAPMEAAPQSANRRGPPAFDHTRPHPEQAGNIALQFMLSVEAVVENGGLRSKPPKGGVLKITNIPYNLTKHEVLGLLGRDAKLLHSNGGTAIHIIMERSSAKTMDCFVEFASVGDAQVAMRKVNDGLPGNPPRLGSRFVYVDMSSQDELLKALFPSAKCVQWRNGVPTVLENKDPWSTGFDGFMNEEELFMMIRHAEFPRRAPFAEKAPQRTYETMISILYKFPWHATKLYSVGDRNAIQRATFRMLQILADAVTDRKTVGLDQRLHLELLFAGIRCPVFNERMKRSLFFAAQSNGIRTVDGPSYWLWPFDTVMRKPLANDQVVARFGDFLRRSCEVSVPEVVGLENKWEQKADDDEEPFYGKIWYEWLGTHTATSFQSAVDYEMGIIREMAKTLAATQGGLKGL